MDFIKANLEDVSLKELLLIMDKNKAIAKEKEEEITKMITISSEEEIIPRKDIVKQDNKVVIKEGKDGAFEEEVMLYLNELNKINEDNISNIEAVLPNRDDYNYERIIYRLELEVLKNIKEIRNFVKEESLLPDEKAIFDAEISLEQEKLLLLKEALLPVNEEVVEEENNLIFIPTTGGNIRVLNELEKMPVEYYPAFLDLLLSIKNSTFKNAKRFSNNDNLAGILEVKGFQVRILYERLDKNNYAVISAFIKKTNNDNGYRAFLDQKISDYFAIKERIKSLLDNEEFLKENKLVEEKIFNLLTKDKAKEKVKRNDQE